MRVLSAVLAAAAAIVAAGCGNNLSCPTETPKVEGVQATCVARPGATVAYPIQYCDPTGVTCDVDLSAVGQGSILLDPKVEVCGGGSASCPTSCVQAPAARCTFTAPAVTVETTYQVFAYDSCSTSNREGTLVVTSDPNQTPNCGI